MKMLYVRVHPGSVAAKQEALPDMGSGRRHGVSILDLSVLVAEENSLLRAKDGAWIRAGLERVSVLDRLREARLLEGWVSKSSIET